MFSPFQAERSRSHTWTRHKIAMDRPRLLEGIRVIIWLREFQSKILDLEFETIESFQNADGSRVASRWRVRGRNNGMFGLPPHARPIEFTGTAAWAVGADGKLLHNWVERSAWELYQRLTH